MAAQIDELEVVPGTHWGDQQFYCIRVRLEDRRRLLVGAGIDGLWLAQRLVELIEDQLVSG